MDNERSSELISSMASDYIRAVLSKNCAQCTKPTHVMCGSLLNNRVTDGNYFVTYKPFTRDGKARKAAFVIHCDVFPTQINRVMSYRHMVSEQYSSIYWNWVVNYTTIKSSDFDHALHNPDLRVFFTLDYDKIASQVGEYFASNSINYKYGGKKDANSK